MQRNRPTYLRSVPRGDSNAPQAASHDASMQLDALENRLAETMKRFEKRLEHALDSARNEVSKDHLRHELDAAVNHLERRIRGELRALTDRHHVAADFDRVLGIMDVGRKFSRANRVMPSIDAFGFDPQFARRVQPLMEFFFRSWFRVEIEGLENVPEHGPVLLAANHAPTMPLSALPFDALMLAHAVATRHKARRKLRCLLEDDIALTPHTGLFLQRLGHVRAASLNALRMLDSGHAVAVFPEGAQGVRKHLSQRNELQRFGRGGVVRLAQKARLPIVPVAIIGADDAYPRLGHINVLGRELAFTPTFPWLGMAGLLPIPRKWKIVFGEPLAIASTLDDRAGIQAQTERLRQRIQAMLEGPSTTNATP